MKNINNNHYDGYYKYDKKVAQSYNSDREMEAHWVEENRYVEQYFKIHKIEKLLDLPVGTGRFFKYYRHISQLVGIDISEDMLDEARKNMNCLDKDIKVTLEKGDVFNLHFANNSFDGIIVFRLFHLIPERQLEAAIKELCRIGSKDIIVQSYEYSSPPFFQRVKRRIKFELKKIIKPKPVQQNTNTTPWSHIEAFTHTENLISDCFKKYEFIEKEKKLLCFYNERKVLATIYSKVNFHK